MIKKLIFISFFFASFLFASNEKFAKQMDYFTDYNGAVKYSIHKYKPIMMTIVTNTCPWCKKLENQVLEKKEVDKVIKTNFTPLLLDRESGSYPKDRFDAKAVPTTFFIDPLKQKVIHQIRGYTSKKEFLKQLEIVKNLYYKGQ